MQVTGIRRGGFSSFGQAFAHIRTRYGWSHSHVAKLVGVDKDTVRAWERDEAVPHGRDLPRILGTMKHMRQFKELLPRRSRDELEKIEAEAPPAVETRQEADESLPAVPEVAKTFGEALRQARIEEGLEQHELGDLVGVKQSTVSNWELGHINPVLDNYNRLLDLLPVLLSAPKPDSQDIDKPAGNVYGPGRPAEALGARAAFPPRRLQVAPGGPPPASPSPPPPPSAPPPLAGRLDSLAGAAIAHAEALVAKERASRRILALEEEIKAAREECRRAGDAETEALQKLRVFAIEEGKKS